MISEELQKEVGKIISFIIDNDRKFISCFCDGWHKYAVGLSDISIAGNKILFKAIMADGISVNYDCGIVEFNNWTEQFDY